MRRSLVAAAILLVGVGLSACATGSGNPFEGANLYLNADTSAANAAQDETNSSSRESFEYLASVPSAIWLLPEVHPTGSIAAFVNGIETDAAMKGQMPVFVVYGIPSRDCGSFSAGGTSDAEYGEWVSQIAEGIGDRKTVLIVEPDSLAQSPSCGTQAAAAAFLNDAIQRLAAPSVDIYLDGGHSHWLPAEEQAALLTSAGVGQVRGFATNVSNYNTTAEEQEYGDRLAALLGGAHFVIDTSRNGNGSNGEWCNPRGRAIGETPAAAVDSGARDANLWIKTPGESDGTCNGGPVAGAWWSEIALELVRGQL